MGRVEIIDCDIDPNEVRRENRRRVVRYGLPIASIVLIAAGLIASTLYTGAMNRADVLELSRNLIDTLNERVLTEVRAYQAPAGDAVDSLAAALPEDPWSESGRSIFERIARGSLRSHPQIAALYIGTADGNFLMVTRNEAGSADTKLIHRTPEGPRAIWTRRDADHRVIATETDEGDRFDPRTRPWYREAVAAGGAVWSSVYIFFTSNSPGITVSRPDRQGGRTPRAVIGADIRLHSLSNFLRDLQKQARGALTIVDSGGQVIASDDPHRIMVDSPTGPRPRTIRELDQPALAEAFDRLRVTGPGRSIVEIDGQRYIFGSSSLRGAVSRDRMSREWWLILLAPESAYLGFVTVNSRQGLIASGGVIVLAIILAGFLAYQGVVADRNARAVRAGEDQLKAQRRIYEELADLSDLADADDEGDLWLASEIVARAEGARRISVWRLRNNRNSMECLDAFDRETHGHTSGMVLDAADFNEVFAQIAEGRLVELKDTAQEPDASGLELTYLQAVGTTSLTSIPVLLPNRILGAIWIEDPGRIIAIETDRSVAATIANLLAPRLGVLAENERTERSPAPNDGGPVGKANPAISIARGDALPQTKTLRTASLIEMRRKMGGLEGNGKSVSASVFPGTTVLSLKLLDDRALAAMSTGADNFVVIRDIVSTFKQIADQSGIRYVKILTNEVLAVDGFGAEPHEDEMREAASRLIDVAMHVRERCNAIFLSAGRGPQFTMGIDSGATFGSSVGFDDSPYNIWGEAVRLASTLAETAEPGTIQVSESTYDLLSEACVFRRRGAFFLGQAGEMTTFTLRGRL